MNAERTYNTTDIYFAATLILMGFSMDGISPVTGKKNGIGKSDIYQFTFKDDGRIGDILLKYSSGSDEVRVKPNDFRSTLRSLKESTRNYE